MFRTVDMSMIPGPVRAVVLVRGAMPGVLLMRVHLDPTHPDVRNLPMTLVNQLAAMLGRATTEVVLATATTAPAPKLATAKG